MRASVMSRSSRMSASSSITSTWLLLIASRSTAPYRKARPRIGFDVVEPPVVHFTNLAGDIEPQTRSAARRREKRFEKLAPQFGRHAGTVVDHIEPGRGVAAVVRDDETDTALLAPAMPDRITAEIPHDLIQMTAIENDDRI